tara:strand:+ start:117 stop:263 length:147 start_codon:yes stop_codon:yes gene_type:complete
VLPALTILWLRVAVVVAPGQIVVLPVVVVQVGFVQVQDCQLLLELITP